MSSYLDSTPTTPIYFILSPGANPVKDVEDLARKLGNDPKKNASYHCPRTRPGCHSFEQA